VDWKDLRPPDSQDNFDFAVDALIKRMAITRETAMKVFLNKFILTARLMGFDARAIHQMVETRYNYSVQNKETLQ
jgi:hypothetical protein